jgi:N-acetylmuramoyl-L-alanine amidase
MRTHVVQQGECVSSIAARYGLSSTDPIRSHPSNEVLRRKHRTPHALRPGDEVVVPDPRAPASCPTERRHVFVVQRPTVRFRVRVLDTAEGPLVGCRFLLKVGGVEKKGRVPDDGVVEAMVPAGAEEGELHVWLDGDGVDDPDDEPALRYALRVGHLDPVDTVAGMQARLDNLGFACPTTGSMCSQTEAALRAFAARTGISYEDEPSDALLERLAGDHGDDAP